MALIQRTPDSLPVHVKVLTVEFHADPPLPEALAQRFLDDTVDAVNEHGYVSDITDPDPAPLRKVDLGGPGVVGNAVPASEYVLRHPDHYELRVTGSSGYGGGIVRHSVALVLVDAQGDPIDESGCNCDQDSPCNNPTCVMERERHPWW